MIFPLIICCRKTRCLSFFFQLLCLNILFLDPYESELISLFINWIHKASAQEVCVPVDFFFPSSFLLFFGKGQSFWKISFWLQFIIIFIIIINLPQISRRILIPNTLLCCKNLPKLKAQWKTGGPIFAYYHGTEVKPKDRDKSKQM